jgi:signal transduction histidine kinase
MKLRWPYRVVQQLLGGGRRTVLSCAFALIAVISFVDWRLDVNISFGFLYVFPMLMVGSSLSRAPIAAIAALCTGLSEAFDPFIWSGPEGIPRVILTFAATFGAGLYAFEATRRREEASRLLSGIRRESELRREAEQQLDFLVSTSPATIFTLDTEGRVLIANDAAHRLLRVRRGELAGQPITRFFAALSGVLPAEKAPAFQTEMECHGRRLDGEVFLARVWFSTYGTAAGPRLAAVVFDASEDLRDREEFRLQQLLSGSRILVGAVCHEMRNMCGAISVVQARLARSPELSANEDLRALGRLVEGLGSMAARELRHSAKPQPQAINLVSLLEELRIVIEPALRESDIDVRWEVEPALPAVWAEGQALLQAFLNLTKNSERAMERSPRKELTVRAQAEERSVVVRVIDTGPGVDSPERLFKPFQPGAEATGLGLYLSRAFVRSFDGDLVHEPVAEGCCFAVRLSAAAPRESVFVSSDHAQNPPVVA